MSVGRSVGAWLFFAVLVVGVGWLGSNIVFSERVKNTATGSLDTCQPVAAATQLRPGSYTGPLFDTHIHAPLLVVPPRFLSTALPFTGTMASLQETNIDDIVCLLEQEGSTGALVFFALSRLIFDESADVAQLAGETYPNQIYPLIMPAPLPLLAPPFEAQTIDRILAGGGDVIRGVGELTFYTDYFQDRGIEPTDQDWRDIYTMIGQRDGIVMMHTTYGQEGALRQIFAANPNVTFILHSNEVEDVLPELLAQYPNVYYTLDTSDFTSLLRDEITGKDAFLQDMARNYDEYMSHALRWQPMIERFPGRFMWGTDRALNWHFDSEVGATLAEFSRDFIGRLSPAAQAPYAHQNAGKLLSN